MVTAVVLLILSTACSTTRAGSVSEEVDLAEKHFPLALVKEKEYRFDIVSRGGPILAKVDDRDHVYAYFLENLNGNCEVIKMSTDLEVKNRFEIRSGVGPGEAQNPRIYGGNEQSIIVYDPPHEKFIRYDADFKLVDEFRIGKDMGTFLYSGGRYDSRRNFVLDGFSQNMDYYDIFIRIFKFELPGPAGGTVKNNLLFETSHRLRRKSNRKLMLGRAVNFGYYFDHIYVMDKRVYRLMKMDTRGHILVDKKIRFESRNFSASLRKKWIKDYYYNYDIGLRRFDFQDDLWTASWMIRLGDGIAVCRVRTYDPAAKGPVTADYFDGDLNYRGQVTLPYFYFWNHPDTGQSVADARFHSRDGKLYFVEHRGDDVYWIVRYGIEYETI